VFHHRSATRLFGVIADRGWKPTATFGGRSATKDKNQRAPDPEFPKQIAEIVQESLNNPTP
jgi:hypothetical protein